MGENIIEQMKNAFETSFINKNTMSNLAYKSHLVSNNYKEGKKVLSSIEDELLKCDEFYFSVAFITMGGLTPLLQTLEELVARGVPGKILTTDYLNFSDPKALRTLANLKNIDVKMYCTGESNVGFHTKGYIFKKDKVYKIIVGSSNLTLSALTVNKEWNTKIVSTENGEFTEDIFHEFNNLWNSNASKDFENFIDQYSLNYEIIKEQKKIAKKAEVPSIQQYKLNPNKMQVDFVASLKKIVEAGEDRALLVSATGTGKTYASAFGVREFNPKKALFLVHREQIAKQSIKSYKNVFDNTKNFGLLSGNSKDYKADYLFSTVQTMSKQGTMERFNKNEFDIIIIDEVHRAGANSYQRIMDYFKPKFWLGMTATPERTDDFNIYNLFDHNIAHEIRLQEALEEDLLCTFHYFGISELEINGEVFDDNIGVRSFNHLVSDLRVDYIIEKINYYGYSGNRVKGLIFCSRKDEARELSSKFNLRGLKTVFLSGDDSQERRINCVERLTNENSSNKLDYIFTVDIFNEGVDIPEINQVIMLRPTESPIVFVQQLGRGLRKTDDKEYVVVLDFIGNYMNNFMIPIALSGDRTYNKDTIRKYVSNGSSIIPGSSTVHFDEVAKDRIYNSINQIKGIKKIIRENYKNLSYKLGRIPTLIDFYENGEIDPLLILSNYKTYFSFLKVVEPSYKSKELSLQEISTLEYLSKVIVQGKRPHELEILKEILVNGNVSKQCLQELLKEKYNIEDDIESIDSALLVLQGNFVSNNNEKEKYAHIDILSEAKEDFYVRMISFYERLKHTEFYIHMKDLLQLGLRRYNDIYSNEDRRRGKFVLYEKYSRRDVCFLLNWGKDLSSVMYGMKRLDDDVAIFVTYHKKEADGGQEYLEGKPDYADQFLNNQTFMWDSQIGKAPDSSYMSDVKEAENKHLFVKKSDAEGTDFYYMGQFEILEIKADKKLDNKGISKDISKVKLQLNNHVREDLYEYLINN